MSNKNLIHKIRQEINKVSREEMTEKKKEEIEQIQYEIETAILPRNWKVGDWLMELLTKASM